MRVTTKFVMNMISGEVLEHEWYEYEGPVALAGGGPSSEQKSAAAAQANLSNQQARTSSDMLNFYKQQQAKIEPFATQRMTNGLPYFNALTDYSSAQNGQAYAPAKAALIRRYSSMGDLPSGFRERSLGDLEAARARGFDQNLQQNLALNETAKNNAAALLTGQQQLSNPLGWSTAASSSNNSIMQAPLQSAGLGGLFGGMAQGAASAFF